jgi:hypothetical protein
MGIIIRESSTIKGAFSQKYSTLLILSEKSRVNSHDTAAISIPRVTMISRCNAALYAPWMAFPFSEAILGVPVPPPPPAELFVPEDYRPAAGETLVRSDDRGQGLLFGGMCILPFCSSLIKL